MDARRLAIIGLVLAAVGLVVPGFHHVRCVGHVAVPAGETTGEGSASCAQTFPSEFVPIAALIGLVGVTLALYAAVRMARASDGARAARVIMALAALALLVPTTLPLAGWASAGFDLAIATPGVGCQGEIGGEVPLWLQTPTCVRWLDVIMIPMGVLAGTLATLAARRGSSRLAIAALGVAGVALVIFAVALAIGTAYPGETWLVPLAGALLLAGALALRRRAPAPAQSA